jgi:putative ABC transport system permease protein
LVVAAEGDPLALADAVREEVAALDPNLPLGDVATMEEQRHDGMGRYWYPMLILGLFAALALALAALGIYGVMSYAVAQRTREIGVRMALGAAREQVVRMVLSEGARVVLAGTAAGLVAGLLLARLMAGLLYEVTPGDPLSLTLVTLVLAAVALAACLLPARRAASVDPMEALRWE